MALDKLEDDYIVMEDDWNAHVTAINTNTSDISGLDSRLGTAESDINAAESKNTDQDSALINHDGRIADLENDSGHHARYYASAAQTVTDSVQEKLSCPTAVITTPDVTANAANDTFTLNKAGVWMVSAGVRWATNSTAGRHIWLSPGDDTLFFYQAMSLDASSNGNTAAAVSIERAFAAGDTISAVILQGSGAALDTAPSGEAVSISLTWVRPA